MVKDISVDFSQLTDEERAEMRQYRREAVKCEARMFERRREKYSDLILQVMSVMDRIQVCLFAVL